MSTVRKTITLSGPQNAWIKRQIAQGDYTNDSEYIRELVRRDQEGHAKLSELKKAIAEGLESGVSDRTLDAIWSEAERRAADA